MHSGTLGRCPWLQTWDNSSWPPPLRHGVLPASAPDLGRGVAPLSRAKCAGRSRQRCERSEWSLRFKGKPFNITVIEVYAPTSNTEEAEVEWFYEDLQDLLESESESEVAQSCPTLCDPVDCSPPGSSIHGILQARILEWVAISFSRGSSQPRDRTHVSRIAGRHVNLWATREGTRPFRTNTQKRCPFIIGDWNAEVGSHETPGVTGKFGLGGRNEAGQRLIDFCQENALVIENTLFQQHKRRLYTWTSADGQQRNQIDYILCSQRWRSSIQSAKTRPGADCGSDHELLITKFRLKLKKVGTTTRPFRYDLNQILALTFLNLATV